MNSITYSIVAYIVIMTYILLTNNSIKEAIEDGLPLSSFLSVWFGLIALPSSIMGFFLFALIRTFRIA